MNKYVIRAVIDGKPRDYVKDFSNTFALVILTLFRGGAKLFDTQEDASAWAGRYCTSIHYVVERLANP